MAKRKRLTLPSDPGADPDLKTVSEGPSETYSDPDAPGGLEVKAMYPFGIAPTRAPIARVTGEAAATAALHEVTAELDSLRREGRLVQRLPLAAVAEDYMLRDRIRPEDAEFDGLLDSLRAHGQRTPIEVTDLGEGRHGLISGWRRLSALRRLAAEDAARFGTVLALVRRPDTAADAYVAMVEENEVRSGLSYWERARIAARSVEAGVFPTEKIALQRLYAAASRARRSKIGSFLALYHTLDGALHFPAALSERAGLALARALAEDPGLADRLRAALAAAPPDSPEAEQAAIEAFLTGPVPAPAPAPSPRPEFEGAEDPAPTGTRDRRQGAGTGPDTVSDTGSIADPVMDTGALPRHEDLGGGVWLRTDLGGQGPGRLELSGPGVGPDLARRLRAWLRDQRRDPTTR